MKQKRLLTMLVLLMTVLSGAWAQEPAKYKITVAEGTEDADKWTISPNPAAAGSPVTATYNGSKKVKSVKAVKKAKAAGTVTSAPTATTGDIVAGSETALVSGGAATGGTMMYKVTTANTKPTSTEGFSDAVPTAKTLAAGTYYVWYYVKADDSHTDSEISASGIEVTIAAAPLTYPIALSAVTSDYIGSVITTDGYVYATAADATAASKTAVAMIAYVGTASDCAHGLAIALADESSSKMTWNTAKSTCSGKTPTITGGTWRLPSIKDWQYMFIGCGASGSYSDSPSSMSYSGLASKLNTAQGSGFQTTYYWSSTEDNPVHNPGEAFYVFFVNGTAVFSSGSEDECRVRACLAF